MTRAERDGERRARSALEDRSRDDGTATGERDPVVTGLSPAEEFRTVVRATQGGLFATIVMSAFRLPLMRSLPPTANFWAKYVGDGHPEEYTKIGLFLHLLYGSLSGTAFGLAYARFGLFPGGTTERRGVVWGGLYGLALSVFGEHVMLRRVLDMDVEPDTETVFHTSHLIYGLALGAWVGSRIPQTQRYDEYEDTR